MLVFLSGWLYLHCVCVAQKIECLHISLLLPLDGIYKCVASINDCIFIWLAPFQSPSRKATIERRRAPVVALDADRGLTVSLRNKTRDGGPYRARQGDFRGGRPYEARRGSGGLYNEHDDRAGVLEDGADLPPVGGLHSDLNSEEDVGLELHSEWPAILYSYENICHQLPKN